MSATRETVRSSVCEADATVVMSIAGTNPTRGEGAALPPVVLAEGDLEILGLIGMVAPVLRPLGRPARDVVLDRWVVDDVRPVGEVAHFHAIEVCEHLLALHALDDAPALVVHDPR